jgi:hypothetical protein
MEAEITQIFVDLKAVLPVLRKYPGGCQDIIVKKFFMNGNFDKVKARLVAYGAQKRRDM